MDFPEITEILEMEFTKEGHHGNTRNLGNGVELGGGCIENCFKMLSQTSCRRDFFPRVGAVL